MEDILVKCVFAEFPSNTRLLVAAERNAGMQLIRTVDPSRTSLEPMRRPQRPVDVLTEHCRSQTVRCTSGRQLSGVH